MALSGLLRVGEVGLRIFDMDEARRHYGDRIGLIESYEGDDDKLYYKCPDEHDLYSLVLRKADEAGIDYVAFKTLEDADLENYEAALAEFGIEVTYVDAGVYPKSGRRLIFTLPTGHEMHIYAHKEQNGNGMPTRNPGTIPDEGYIRGMRTVRLDHVLLGGPNIETNREIFDKVFGFALSEQIVDHETETPLAIFLSASTKPHDIAFLIQPESNRFHHVSFLLESVNDLYHAADLIGKHEIAVDVAPNRHGVTRGATIYFFDPFGNRNEVFTGGYVHYPDTPTLTWDTTQIGRATFSHDNMPRESFLNVLT
ncbi:catechol 2,3-dioxygenase [Novosphingobium mangrovi (ex Huang et al. 2023)]|uniref:Metapyrocatechase n=1 Tax=Novosphingobium mangrovi (ex Huang et al. 2023) TaxID=2976432 RepID=A0ABT2I996_9SPHN|nr:catechol 2,3-dioxygenase [Novosphingobium mangrovi (ex Huang et al. 2023)]MCT2401405.1 catechol 2,3-dioxygenase [Novosphingobium mangrovi (ex Huang et al. 2023)]